MPHPCSWLVQHGILLQEPRGLLSAGILIKDNFPEVNLWLQASSQLLTASQGFFFWERLCLLSVLEFSSRTTFLSWNEWAEHEVEESSRSRSLLRAAPSGMDYSGPQPLHTFING